MRISDINYKKKTALRDAYGVTLKQMGERHKDLVVFDADLSTSTKTHDFALEFPNRFYNMGIAEQNMVNAAAGISTIEYVPFVSTFAIFAAERSFEQIRNSIAYPNLNVKIVVTHAGLSAGKDGGSHEAVEDIALMRSLANMTVIVPCDDLEVSQTLEAIYNMKGPAYVRLSRMELPRIHDDNYQFQIGKGEVLRDGDDITIAACGSMVIRAVQAADQLREEGISAAVLNFPTIKPIDRELLVQYAEKTNGFVCAEEHTVFGGLYSSICEVLSDLRPTQVKEVGIRDQFGQTGTPDELFEIYGLTQEHIINNVHEVLDAN